MKVMETERLLLRPFVLEDVDGLYREIYSDFEVVRYYSGKGVLSREDTLRHLMEHLQAWREDVLGRHAVIVKESGEFAGQVDMSSYVNTYYRWEGEPESPYNELEVELSFAFGRRFWGKSYAFEACQAMIAYGFGELRLRRLVGGFDEANVRSGNLHRRLGYRVVPNLRQAGGVKRVTILDNFLV